MLTSRDKETLRQFLLDSTKSKKLNRRLVRFLDQDFSDCVFINGMTVHATEENKWKLKTNIAATFGSAFLDPVDALASRIDVAKTRSTEKDAHIQPEAFYVTITQQSGSITCLGLKEPMPIGMAVRAHVDAIDLSQVEHVIIVENLAAFDYWHQVRLPSQLSSAIAIYRGHDSTAKSVKTLLARCACRVNIVAFMDYDPEGVRLALTLPYGNSVLIPELSELDSSDLAKLNRHDLYVKQTASLAQLNSHSVWAKYGFVRQLDKLRLAITQEVMIARKIELLLCSLE